MADFEIIEKVYVGDIKDCVLLINAASPDFNEDLIKIALINASASPEAIEAKDRDSLIKIFRKAGVKIEITEVRK